MPLVVISGRPCTGKTTFTSALVSHLLSSGCVTSSNLHVFSDEQLNISKQKGYINAAAEKASRGALKAAVERACDGTATVIVDSLNYIKGFRYELYCIARAAATTHCVVWVDGSLDTAKLWNTKREQNYPEAVYVFFLSFSCL